MMARGGGVIDQVRRDLTAAIDSGRFDIDDVELALHVTAGSFLGLTALLDANPELHADVLADEYAVRILRAFGLSESEATRLASLPLPELPRLA